MNIYLVVGHCVFQQSCEPILQTRWERTITWVLQTGSSDFYGWAASNRFCSSENYCYHDACYQNFWHYTRRVVWNALVVRQFFDVRPNPNAMYENAPTILESHEDLHFPSIDVYEKCLSGQIANRSLKCASIAWIAHQSLKFDENEQSHDARMLAIRVETLVWREPALVVLQRVALQTDPSCTMTTYNWSILANRISHSYVRLCTSDGANKSFKHDRKPTITRRLSSQCSHSYNRMVWNAVVVRHFFHVRPNLRTWTAHSIQRYYAWNMIFTFHPLNCLTDSHPLNLHIHLSGPIANRSLTCEQISQIELRINLWNSMTTKNHTISLKHSHQCGVNTPW